MLIVYTLFSIILTVIEAFYDKYVYASLDFSKMKENEIWHAIKFAMIAGFYIWISLEIINYQFGESLTAAAYLIYFGGIRWLLFDAVYNRLRGKTVFYVGTVAKFDTMLRSVATALKIKPELVAALMKLLMLAAALFFLLYRLGLL